MIERKLAEKMHRNGKTLRQKTEWQRGRWRAGLEEDIKKMWQKIKIGLQWVPSVLIGVQSVKNLHSQHSDLYLHKKGQDEQFCMPVFFFVVLGGFFPVCKTIAFFFWLSVHPLHGQAQPPSQKPLCARKPWQIFSKWCVLSYLHVFFNQQVCFLMLCKTNYSLINFQIWNINLWKTNIAKEFPNNRSCFLCQRGFQGKAASHQLHPHHH